MCANWAPLPGKSSHCEPLAQATGLKHLSINQVVKDKSCHDGYDDDLKSWIVNEDKVFCFSPTRPISTGALRSTDAGYSCSMKLRKTSRRVATSLIGTSVTSSLRAG